MRSPCSPVCRRAGFKPRIVKEADGAASALAFAAAGFGVALVGEPLQKIPARDVVFRNLTPEDRAWVPVGAAWKPEAVSAPLVSQFADVLAQAVLLSVWVASASALWSSVLVIL
jgi:DNA-binding transcriptional LysR family regulator